MIKQLAAILFALLIIAAQKAQDMTWENLAILDVVDYFQL